LLKKVKDAISPIANVFGRKVTVLLLLVLLSINVTFAVFAAVAF
jgi:hypothetical protein